MSYYGKLVSRIQSRMSKRANQISSLDQWRLLYKAQQNYGDMKEAKKRLREMESSQRLDKEILKEFEEAAYVEANYAAFEEGFK